jgi:hypothetical protein
LSHREFIDRKGEKWDVWLVIPVSAERRKAERRAAAGAGASAYTGDERRGRLPDRRLSALAPRATLSPEFRNGWLCFENASGEKRRLVPVPQDWERMSVQELLKLLSSAKRVVRCGVR